MRDVESRSHFVLISILTLSFALSIPSFAFGVYKDRMYGLESVIGCVSVRLKILLTQDRGRVDVTNEYPYICSLLAYTPRIQEKE